MQNANLSGGMFMADIIRKDKNNNMGTLHMIGALFVMLGHQSALLGVSTPVILGNPIQSIGVKLIFLISGYLITRSIWNIHGGGRVEISKIYLFKRIGRIYPEYIVCLLFSVLIIGPLCTELAVKDYFGNYNIWLYFINNIRLCISYGLPEVFMNNPYVGAVNGSLWTIPVEIMLYIILWIIVIIPNNKKVSRHLYLVVSVLAICGLLIRIQFYQYNRAIIYGTDWLQALDIMPYFIIGGLFYLYDLKKYVNIQLAAVGLFVFCGVTLESRFINELICMVVLSNFVMAVSLDEKQELKIRRINCECAYGMYLYGFVVQQFLISKIYVEKQIHLNWLLLFVISVICTYFLALLSNWLIYKPVKNFIAKKCSTL